MPRTYEPLPMQMVCSCRRPLIPVQAGRYLDEVHLDTGSGACWDTPPDVSVWLPPEREDPPGSGLLCDVDLRLRRTRFNYSPGRKLLRAMIDDPEGGCWCVRCGARVQLEVDHIWPLARGGTNNLINLQVLCISCNARKGYTLSAGVA